MWSLRVTPSKLSHVLAALALCVSMSGCALLGQLLAGLDQYRPRISVSDFAIKGMGWDSLDVELKLKIDNPNPLEVTMDSFRYALALSGQEVLRGDQNTGVPFKAYGTSEARLPLKLQWSALFKTHQQLKGKKQLPFALKGDLGFATPLGHVDVPWEKIGTLPKLDPPEILPAQLRFLGVDILAGVAKFALDLDVSNPDGNGPIELNGFAFDVSLDGQQAASGQVTALAAVPQGKTVRKPLVMQAKLATLGAALAKKLSAHGDVDVLLRAKVMIKTPFGEFPLSFSKAVRRHVD